MDLKDLFPPTNIGEGHHHLAVKAARPQQSGVQHIRTVGGGNHDHPLIAFKTIHLYQQLVERLFPLIMAPAQTGATVAAYRIDFIDEDDTGGVLLCLFEHIAHASSTDTDKHFDKIGTGNRKKRHLGFTGNRLRQQGFTGPGRTHHQHATGNPAAQFLEFAGITEKFHQFGHLFLGLFDAGDIIEGNLNLILSQHAGLAATEGHGTAATATALHLAHEKDPHGDQQQHREPGDKDLHQKTLLFLGTGTNHDVMVQQVTHQTGIARAVGGKFITTLSRTVNRTAINDDFLHLIIIHLGNEIGIGKLSRGNLWRAEVIEYRNQYNGNNHPQDNVFNHVIQITVL